MRKISLAYILILIFSACGVSGTTKPTCESDAGNECDCNEEDVYSLAPETQQTVICSESTHLEGDECVANEVEGLDQDGDGFPYPEDCDDRRIDVNPEAEEICDARDNDCDGEMDGEGVCAYECTNTFVTYDQSHSENEVNINLAYTTDYSTESSVFIIMSGCRPNYLRFEPPFMIIGDAYKMRFDVSGLEPGDVIERFVVRQIIGETPIPLFYDESSGIEGRLELRTLHYENDEGVLGEQTYSTYQNNDGSFIFEYIPIPNNFSPYLTFSLGLRHGFAGSLQISFEGLEDFIVTGKDTITGRPFPQQGEYVMVLCPDRDNDGEDDHRCGGTDPDDKSLYPDNL